MFEKLKSFGENILGILFFVAFIVLIALLFNGVLFISEKVLPFLFDIVSLLTLLIVTVIIPMLFFKSTRQWSLVGLFFFSYIFGTTLWLYSALVTYVIWGFWGIIIGLMLLGIGVFPVALVASVFDTNWSVFFGLIYIALLTYGTRGFSLYLAKKWGEEEIADTYKSTLPQRIDTEIKDAEIYNGDPSMETESLFVEDSDEENTSINTKIFCSNCGSKVREKAKFCFSCGKDLN